MSGFVFDTGGTQIAVPQPTTGEGFARFGITHLSASSINLWTNAPDVWVAKYVLDRKADFPYSAAAERGKAVEAAVVAILSGRPRENTIDYALRTFDRYAPPSEDRERDLIVPMIDAALAELEQYGTPEFIGDGQDKISINAVFDGWSIPVIGYLDMVFPDHGLVVDLKTTTRVPSTMSPDHQLQRAIYARAKGNMTVRFLYTSGKRSQWLEDGDPAFLLAQAKVQIARMDAFLRACPDADTARAIVPTGPFSFYWRGAEALRNELYGV